MTVDIRVGDCRELLKAMPDESVHCVVTSPPYYGLRDYGVAGQIGSEATPDEHIAVPVEVFEEVRRVLRKDGNLWLNYGDCYASSPNGKKAAECKRDGSDDRTFRDKPFSTVGGIFKPKDLMLMPSRVAIALHAAGWWVRSENIWHKPNPMPDSAIDRTTPAHEKVFHLTRSARYWYDADAVRTPLAEKTLTIFGTERHDLGNDAGGNVKASNWARTVPKRTPKIKMPDGLNTAAGAQESFHPQGCEKGKTKDKQRGHSRRHAGFNDRWNGMSKAEQQFAGANLRNVWTIATAAFDEAHFATFPPALVEPCIKAGCPTGGVVLDPFGGAGTVGLVADRLGRNSILFELNPEYAAIAERRIKNDAGMFGSVTTKQEESPALLSAMGDG